MKAGMGQDGRVPKPLHKGEELSRPRRAAARISFGLAVALTLLLSGCRSQGYTSVSMNPGAPKASPAATEPAPIRLGLAPILSVQGSGAALTALCQALSSHMGRPVTPLLGGDYREINDMLGLGQLDVGIVCAGAYADPRLCRVCEPLVVPLLIGSGSTYQSYLVVQAQNPARSLEDLKGASFEFTDSLSLTGYIFPVARLCALRQKPGAFFRTVAFSHSHDRSLSLVADGTVDAAAVDSTVFKVWTENHPRQARHLRILERSEPFPAPPIVVEDQLSSSGKEALHAAFLDLTSTKAGQAILKEIGWTGFQQPDALWRRRMDHLNRLFGNLRAKNCLAS